MPLWSHVAAGCAQDTAAVDDLREALRVLLADPRYGTGHSALAGPVPGHEPQLA